MKRIVCYLAALLLLTFSPVEEADIGKLHPVEVVMLYREGNEIVIKTDTDDWGRGADGLAALKNLKETTPGTIYLDTAQYLLLGEGGMEWVEQLRPVLKKTVRVCEAENQIDLQNVTVFLSVHGTLPQLKGWNPGVDLPKLTVVEKRLKMS